MIVDPNNFTSEALAKRDPSLSQGAIGMTGDNRLTSALEAGIASILSDHQLGGPWAQYRQEMPFAADCGCGETFFAKSEGEARDAWVSHVVHLAALSQPASPLPAVETCTENRAPLGMCEENAQAVEQEAVAWMYEKGDRTCIWRERAEPGEMCHTPGWTETPLYASPPPVGEQGAVKREIMERTRNMMTVLSDLREAVDLDDESSVVVLGFGTGSDASLNLQGVLDDLRGRYKVNDGGVIERTLERIIAQIEAVRSLAPAISAERGDE